MSAKPKVSPEDRKALALERGARLKSALSLAGFNASGFSKKYADINLNSLHAWVSGSRLLTKDAAQKISHGLRKEGWMCSSNWLLEGTGLAPTPLDQVNRHLKVLPPVKSDSKNTPLEEDLRIAKESLFFRELNPESDVIIVEDESMIPYFSPGDMVGGMYIEDGSKTSCLFGQPCIIENEEGDRLLRFLHKGLPKGRYTLVASNPGSSSLPEINVKIKRIAPVLWVRRSLKGLLRDDAN